MAKRIAAAVRKYMAERGREGGKKSAQALTPEKRTERARAAAVARWSKKHEFGGFTGAYGPSASRSDRRGTKKTDA